MLQEEKCTLVRQIQVRPCPFVLRVCTCVCLCLRVVVCVSLCLGVCVCLSICLSASLSICLSVFVCVFVCIRVVHKHTHTHGMKAMKEAKEDDRMKLTQLQRLMHDQAQALKVPVSI